MLPKIQKFCRIFFLVNQDPEGETFCCQVSKLQYFLEANATFESSLTRLYIKLFYARNSLKTKSKVFGCIILMLLGYDYFIIRVFVLKLEQKCSNLTSVNKKYNNSFLL